MARYLLHLCFFLIIGCATLEGRMESFEMTTFRYENAMRWGYYQLANDYRETHTRKQNSPDFEKLKEIKVITYELLKSQISENQLEAHQTVEIKYYNINNLIEKTLIDEQLWEYNREDNKWYLKSSFPDFKY